MKPRVLIVDDKVSNLVALEAVLSDLDAELVRAESGEEALTQLINLEVALILMDVQMPGLDGFETASLIRGRRHLKHVPIIFVTAISREQKHVFKGYETGAVDYLFKPLDAHIVQSKVRVFLQLYRQRKALEEKTESLERQVDLLNQFARVASHDLKAPLRSITSFSRRLEKHLGDDIDEVSTRCLSFLLRAGTRLEDLIEDLLEYSRLGHEKEEPTRFALRDVLAEALESLTATMEDTGASIKADALPEIIGHRVQMRRLFENLIGNALKYRSDEAPTIRITCEQPTPSLWEIAIHDNGLGIDAAYAEQIFEPFQRLHGHGKYHGTGIGLATCRTIVRDHAGQIRCVSEGPGHGSTFIITLPHTVSAS